MNRVLKEKLKARAEELYEQQRHEDIIDLLIKFDIREDYELALMLTRAFIDLSTNKNDDMLDSAEMMLMLFPNAANDPRMKYQLARAYYFKERFIESYRELENAVKLADAGAPFPERDEAEELENIVKQNYDMICSTVYSEKEKKSVLRHIMRHFGSIDKLISYKNFEGVQIEIAEVPPDPEEDRDHYVMVTVGMGAHKMNIPKPYSDMVEPRAELVMYLPPDMDEDMRLWAVNYMCTLARLPIERSSWSSFGHVFSNGRALMKGTDLMACTLIEIQDADEDAPFCLLPNGDMVVFYQIFPLYKEEVEFKLENGLGELIDRMPHISAVLDLHRENVCRNEKKHTPTLLAEETDYVSDLDVGEFCIASKMITEQGFRVGYMRRFLIDRPDMDIEMRSDSGWLFMSGRETGEFLSDPSNIELCRLNTVCNIDSEIVPFLTMPYNTAVVRDTDGRLRAEEILPPDDELLS